MSECTNVAAFLRESGFRLRTTIGIVELLERRIDMASAAALRKRWEFGRELLGARDDEGRLPAGFFSKLMKATGKSRSELRYRELFAATYPETELLDAISTFGSWDRIVESLKVRRRRIADGRVDAR
jgi:hypothetical protein